MKKKKVSKSKLAKLAKKIKLIALDVDGVLTTGEIIVFDSTGEEIKLWDVKDRFAFYLVKRAEAGIKFAWITGRSTAQVEKRSKEIGIDFLYQDCMRKKDALNEILGKTGIKPDEVLFIGDDLMDVPVLKYVGLAICPKNAPKEIKDVVDYISPISSGKGLMREAAELVLKSQNLWRKSTDEYLKDD